MKQIADKAEGRRVLIVDDHPVVRAGIVHFLKEEAGLTVCGEAASISEARARATESKPDLILLDLLLRKINALDLIKDFAVMEPRPHILVLSMMSELVYASRCLKAGASGFIMKEEAADELLQAIDVVLSGKVYTSPAVAQQLISSATNGKASRRNGTASALSALTNRQLQVFELVGEGLPPRQIASLLSISPKTVEAHKDHIKDKLGVETSAELATIASQWNAERQG